MTDTDDAAWDDPDRAVQMEDSDPEQYAGVEVDFDPDAVDEPGPDDAIADEPTIHDRLAVDDGPA